MLSVSVIQTIVLCLPAISSHAQCWDGVCLGKFALGSFKNKSSNTGEPLKHETLSVSK